LNDDTALIAIDWGTTSARAYRLGAGGRVLDERSAPLGIQQVRDGAFAAAFASLLGPWQGLAVPRLACGMIGSRQGWVEASYRACPVAISALAGDLTHTPGREMAIVSGITCRDDSGVPDVMRGEETQIVGLVDETSDASLVVQPGTHSKWTLVRRDPAQGAIIHRFATYMTGETFAVLRDHSILGRLMRPAETFEREAFERGARRAIASRSGGEILHQIFGARALGLFEEIAPESIADYLSGMLIGAEVAAGARWAGQASDEDALWLAGSEVLCMRYALALRLVDRHARIAPSDVAARGLWRIALHAGLVKG